MMIPLSSPDITELEINAVLDVLKTPNLSLGPKLGEFESIVAEYVGVKYAVAVNSGTSGLHLAVRSLGINDGDEVITTPFSFIASANCLLFERAKPVFVDIDPLTLNMDVSKIEASITGKTKAILSVDVFGLPCAMDEIWAIAKRYDLKVIEDSCEALGATYKNHKAGTLGDVGLFAFYPNKQITTGEGGIICTDDKEIAELCRSMRNQGRDVGAGWLQHARLGYNYRISDINCALGIAQMSRLSVILKSRSAVAEMYNKRLNDCKLLKVPEETIGDSKRSWFVYVVQLTDDFSQPLRNSILKRLRQAGIGCSAYFTPIHLQPFYVEQFGYSEGDFPSTESIARRTIALPFFNNLTEDNVNYICGKLKQILGDISR